MSLSCPDDADYAVPELMAFWEYLKHEYKLPHADSILEFLRRIESEFNSIINDSSKFGMAKSFFTVGREAGFDMTREEDIQKFMILYNAGQMARAGELPESYPDEAGTAGTRKANSKKKKRRKTARSARRRNRRIRK